MKTPDWAIDEITEIIKVFVWNQKKGLITEEKATKAWKEGGITLPQIGDLCKAARIKLTLRARDLEDSVLWAKNFMYEVKKIGGDAVFHPQTQISELTKKEVPRYVREQVETWQKLQISVNKEWSKEINEYSPTCYNRCLQMPITNRSKKTVLLDTPYLQQVGACRLGHWFDSQGKTLSMQAAIGKGISGKAIFEWQKVTKAIRKAKITLNIDKHYSFASTPAFNPKFFTSKEVIEASDITQKRILSEIANAIDYKPNGTQEKFTRELDITEEEFRVAFRDYKKDNPCTRKQEFQFKLLSGVVYSNKAYRRMGRKDSSKCTFCEEESQTFLHLFIFCPKVIAIRSELAKNWQGDQMDRKRWFLGVSQSNEVLEKSKNIIAKELNHFIFKMNWAGTELSVDGFKNWLRSDERTRGSTIVQNE